MGSYITFPELLIWLPVLAGILCFIAGKENSAKTIAMFSSLIVLAISVATLFYTDKKLCADACYPAMMTAEEWNNFKLNLNNISKDCYFLIIFSFKFLKTKH